MITPHKAHKEVNMHVSLREVVHPRVVDTTLCQTCLCVNNNCQVHNVCRNTKVEQLSIKHESMNKSKEHTLGSYDTKHTNITQHPRVKDTHHKYREGVDKHSPRDKQTCHARTAHNHDPISGIGNTLQGDGNTSAQNKYGDATHKNYNAVNNSVHDNFRVYTGPDNFQGTDINHTPVQEQLCKNIPIHNIDLTNTDEIIKATKSGSKIIKKVHVQAIVDKSDD